MQVKDEFSKREEKLNATEQSNKRVKVFFDDLIRYLLLLFFFQLGHVPFPWHG